MEHPQPPSGRRPETSAFWIEGGGVLGNMWYRRGLRAVADDYAQASVNIDFIQGQLGDGRAAFAEGRQ